ncbi:MAG: hypothetical protein ABF746_00170 [Acetobacter orientalis]|uniref:hypothetical protein n=1 Tax=Acetobacter orientalis TaxID=146474 RepID=UPI0039EAE85C
MHAVVSELVSDLACSIPNEIYRKAICLLRFVHEDVSVWPDECNRQMAQSTDPRRLIRHHIAGVP